MKKFLPYLIVLVVLLAAFAVYKFVDFGDSDTLVVTNNTGANTPSSPETENPSQSTQLEGTPPVMDTEFPGGLSDEDGVGGGADTQVFTISYDGTKFTPSTLTIRKGDIVIFENNSTEDFRPASGPHPEHTNYPEFDSQDDLGPGKEFQFKFEKVGTWPFHNHLNEEVFGRITVTN